MNIKDKAGFFILLLLVCITPVSATTFGEARVNTTFVVSDLPPNATVMFILNGGVPVYAFVDANLTARYLPLHEGNLQINVVNNGIIESSNTVIVLSATGGGGCFIATAAYGTPVHEKINILRTFRDEVLLQNPIGSVVVETYYATSPPIADAMRNNVQLRAVIRTLLIDPLVYFAESFLNGILFLLVGILFIPLIVKKQQDSMKKMLHVATIGISSVIIFILMVFLLGAMSQFWVGFAYIGAYILPAILPVSLIVVMFWAIRRKKSLNRHLEV